VGGSGSGLRRYCSIHRVKDDSHGCTFPLIPPPASSGVQGVARITDGTDTLVYWDRDAPSVVAWQLVDRRVLAMLSQGHALAGVEPVSPGHQALRLFDRRTLE
jgi:hypothetical protein